ncbi:MAG: NADPH-dependent 7-cyano-7-deazaguanine reductase QueF [Casimicrobiaceae bacterium]
MNTSSESPLGKATAYPDRYDASLLFAIERAPQRAALGVGAVLPFSGVDIWTAYEINWLDASGKPKIAIGEFRVGADSPAIVESKSLKLYLGSFAQERVGTAELGRAIEADLARTCAAPVSVALLTSPAAMRVAELPGESIDAAEVTRVPDQLDAALLVRGTGFSDETLRTGLFRSNCPVTGQPDYADVMVRYRGPRIDRGGLLGYLLSYRLHAGFHESCVERMFIDLALGCRLDQLTVYARFLRRGGIDINPFRSNFEPPPTRSDRTPRQ